MIQRLCRTANLLAEEDSYLTEQIQKILKTVRDRSYPHRLVTRSLLCLPLALQRRTIRAWLEAEVVKDIDFELVESILYLLHDHSTARLNLTQNWKICRREGRLLIQKPKK